MNMQTDFESNRGHFPQVNRKPPTINSLFELIKLKKAEFSRQIDDIEPVQPSLPHIRHERKESEDSFRNSADQLEERQLNESQDLRTSEYNSNKYKTILESIKVDKKIEKKSSNDNSLMMSRKQNLADPKNRILRTKTEFRPIQPRKLTSNTSAAQGLKDIKEEQKFEEVEEAKRRFFVSVQQIPKSMKQRNEDNLNESIACLEAFNPFFFRNQRIVNICLLKMGRIILKDSPYQLYKAGEELTYFYIILAGKVKIADGYVKRVCQTGETILQETLFTDKAKRVALERAKVIGPTYLLELQLQEYGKLKEELIRYGLKLAFQQMEAIIKRNFIIKNWMRNKRKSEVRR